MRALIERLCWWKYKFWWARWRRVRALQTLKFTRFAARFSETPSRYCLCTQGPNQTLGLVSEYPTPQNAACPRISPKYLQNEMQTVHNSWILRYWWPGLARYRPVTACTNPDSLYFRRRAKLAALQPSLLQSVQRVMNLELVGKLYICDKNSVSSTWQLKDNKLRQKMLKTIVPQFFSIT